MAHVSVPLITSEGVPDAPVYAANRLVVRTPCHERGNAGANPA